MRPTGDRYGKAWAREHFRGFENVLIPSFSPDLRHLDEAGIRLDVRQSMRHGFFSTHCALEAGLRREEQHRMLAVAAEEAGGSIGISLSLAGESVSENIAMLKFAETVGATHAVLSYPQSFLPKTQDQVYGFVREIADSTRLGICLLASDKFALHHLHPSGMPFEAYERLAELDNVIALTLSGMDAGLVLEAFERLSPQLLLTSTHFSLLPMLCQNFALQWSGPGTVEALQSPERPYAVQFLNELRAGHMASAMEIYWSLAPALGATARVLAPLGPSGTQHWPMLKYQQWLSGGNGGLTRQPTMRMFQRDMQVVRQGLRTIGIDCHDPDEGFYVGRGGREVTP